MKIETPQEFTLILSLEEMKVLHALLGCTNKDALGKKYGDLASSMYSVADEALGHPATVFDVHMTRE